MRSLLESIFDDDILDRETDATKLIETWILKNYELGALRLNKDESLLDIYYNKHIKQWVVDCKSYGVRPYTNITSLNNNGMFEWGKINNFDCNYCEKLTSLEGAPKNVSGYFECKNCEKLTSLKGAPKIIGGHFSCKGCKNLTSLEGAPHSINRGFDCSETPIKSFEGGPKYAGHLHCMACHELISLKGAPKLTSPSAQLIITDCPKLKSLRYMPKSNGEVIIIGCPLIKR